MTTGQYAEIIRRIEAVERLAEDAFHKAEAIEDDADDLENRVDDLEHPPTGGTAGVSEDDIQTLRDQIRYLEQRLWRLEATRNQAAS